MHVRYLAFPRRVNMTGVCRQTWMLLNITSAQAEGQHRLGMRENNKCSSSQRLVVARYVQRIQKNQNVSCRALAKYES